MDTERLGALAYGLAASGSGDITIKPCALKTVDTKGTKDIMDMDKKHIQKMRKEFAQEFVRKMLNRVHNHIPSRIITLRPGDVVWDKRFCECYIIGPGVVSTRGNVQCINTNGVVVLRDPYDLEVVEAPSADTAGSPAAPF